jgi:hypothetical protein
MSSCKGQNLAEVALVIGVLGIVLIGMQTYIKRGLQGKIKDLADNMVGKQEAYPNDASKLIINSSSSSLSSDSTVTLKELKGGGRSSVGSENSISSYNSATSSNN